MVNGNGWARPVGARSVEDDAAELVLETDAGEVRVCLSWEGWKNVLCVLACIKAELLGLAADTLTDGQVVAYQRDHGRTWAAPRRAEG